MTSGVLVVGHGSKLEHNRDLVVALARQLNAQGEFGLVEAAFMQLNAPDIPTGMERMVDRGVDIIYVVPCFLAAGVHTTEDIPEELGLGKGRTKGRVRVKGRMVEVRYCLPMGEDPRLVDILADRVRAEMRP